MDTLQTGCRCLPKESLPSHNNSLLTEPCHETPLTECVKRLSDSAELLDQRGKMFPALHARAVQVRRVVRVPDGRCRRRGGGAVRGEALLQAV